MVLNLKFRASGVKVQSLRFRALGPYPKACKPLTLSPQATYSCGAQQVAAAAAVKKPAASSKRAMLSPRTGKIKKEQMAKSIKLNRHLGLDFGQQ